MRKRIIVRAAAVLVLTGVFGGLLRAADPDVTPDQIHAALKQLDASGDKTAASRISVARVAMGAARASRDPAASRADYEAALEVLNSAAAIDPTNKEVADLQTQVLRALPPAPSTAPAVPAPATNPAPANPGVPAPAPATKPAPLTSAAKRQVTPAELNRIRQIEWKPDEMPKPTFRIDPDTRKKFVAASPDITPAEFNKMTPDAQAALILASDKTEFRSGVHVMTDPMSMKDFKTGVERIVVQSCAAAGCHTANKAGDFSLYVERNDAAVYTNFLILQQYKTRVGGVEHLMVDRTTPEASLLLQFLLPTELADAPHPAAPGFKAPVRSKTDPRFAQISKWLKSLDANSPQYGIDLTSDPAPDAPLKK